MRLTLEREILTHRADLRRGVHRGTPEAGMHHILGNNVVSLSFSQSTMPLAPALLKTSQPPVLSAMAGEQTSSGSRKATHGRPATVQLETPGATAQPRRHMFRPPRETPPLVPGLRSRGARLRHPHPHPTPSTGSRRLSSLQPRALMISRHGGNPGPQRITLPRPCKRLLSDVDPTRVNPLPAGVPLVWGPTLVPGGGMVANVSCRTCRRHGAEAVIPSSGSC